MLDTVTPILSLLMMITNYICLITIRLDDNQKGQNVIDIDSSRLETRFSIGIHIVLMQFDDANVA